MSCTRKNQTTQNHLCDVCKINISTEAEYALHEFSKKHCDNLLRIAKNKPVVSKQKAAKSEMPTVNKEESKVSAVTTQGNFAKYGYFVPGEMYDTNTEAKEFNTEYDPYVQKYAENPFKDHPKPVRVQPVELPLLPVSNVTSFKRKKKKKIRTCQICNVKLLTVPEYEAHMKSPQHSWRLKMSGMGVSAHFVKASSDLHTVEMNENSAGSEEDEEPSIETDYAGTGNSSVIFPTLYCDICELFLNSEQEFTSHVNGKSHNDNVQRKAEMKSKKQQLESICLNQLYCFSCKVALNNLQQYNEHKFGKKHKIKCRRLMREGITIPPEERVLSWGVPKIDPNKPVVYPEMYEKFLIDAQQKGNLNIGNKSKVDIKDMKNNYCCHICSVSYSNISAYQLHVTSEEHQRLTCNESQNVDARNSVSRLVFHNKNNTTLGGEIKEEIGQVRTVEESHNDKQINALNIVGCSEAVKCSVCSLEFTEQASFVLHLSTEDHYRKILELKGNDVTDDIILNMLIRDRSAVKPDGLDRYTCSLCSVTTGSILEYRQHVSSVVHKQTEEEYHKKVRIELKSAIKPDETGTFLCQLCVERYPSVMEFTQHLHMVNHKEKLRKEKARKRKLKMTLLLQHKRLKQKYVISGLKRKNFTCWRKNCEKNPRKTEFKERISSEEGQEPKTGSTGEEVAGKQKSEEKRVDTNKRVKHNKWNRGMQEAHGDKSVKPLMALNNSVAFVRQPPPLMSTTPWRACYNPLLRPIFRPCFGNNPRGRYPSIRYQRAPNFRPCRPRYPPSYN